ncbi:MAG: hypothetical protein B7Y93_08790, partial [Micrococcales bacterium 32-70-13]
MSRMLHRLLRAICRYMTRIYRGLSTTAHHRYSRITRSNDPAICRYMTRIYRGLSTTAHHRYSRITRSNDPSKASPVVTLRALVIACLITALVGAGGGMLGASLFAAASGPAGAQGPAGESGVDGADGANGADGVDGAPGQPGAPGAAGAAGPAGARGAAGPQGPAGATGAPGPQGTPGPQGEAGPQGAPGVVDFAYFAVGAQLVQPGTGITLPLTAVSGELDLELATGGSGGAGGVLTLQPGIYRFSTLLRVTSIDSVTPGALAIRTEY